MHHDARCLHQIPAVGATPLRDQRRQQHIDREQAREDVDSEIDARGAVHDDVRPYRVQQRNDGSGVLEIRGRHAIMRRSRYAHHIMAGADELAASGTSQEAACAGDQHLHHYAFLAGRAMTVTLRPMPHLVIAWQRPSSGAMPFSASRRSNSTRAWWACFPAEESSM